MRNLILRFFITFVLYNGVFSSCIKDDAYLIPVLECITPNIHVNKTIQDIYIKTTPVPSEYLADDVIEAYVISSDKEGNYFRTIHLQALNNSIAFIILTDYANSSTLYQPGRRVLVKMKGLYTQIRDGSLMVGSFNDISIGKISSFNMTKIILRDCKLPINESKLTHKVTLSKALSSNIYINQLIEIDKIQFDDDAVNQPYYMVGTSSTYRNLIDEKGNQIGMRSTSFTKFGFKTITANSGRIKGIITRFGTTYLFTPRYESDIQLTDPRFVNAQVFLIKNP